ncbi:hypothetical protein LguiB_018602 [Lonicera macranthoides]
MAILLVFLLLGIPLFLLLLKHRKNGERLKSPPGPRRLPFIGNLHQLDTAFLHHYLWQLSKKYGPLMSLQLGFVPTLIVSSAKMAKEVMKTHDLVFCSRPGLLGLQKLSYKGLDVAMSPYNDSWRELKKIVTLHLLSSKRVQSFRPIREEEVSRMIAKVSQLAASSKLVNLSEMITTLTSSTICRVAFGKRFDEGYEGSKFHNLLIEWQVVAAKFYFSDHFPLIGWMDNVTGLCARLDKLFREMDLVYQELIDDHLDPKRKNSSQEDLIDILLGLREEQSSSVDFSFDHIKAVLMNMLLGGTDTSSATVVWAMTELMKNPSLMKKAQEEVRKLIGEKGRVDEDDLQKLPYLEAVVKETLRFHPAVPLLVPRETMQSCVVDGYEIRPETLVYVNAYAIGRDPECWEDPEKFFPERFLNSTIDYKGLDFEFIPFGAGRRKCPGISMGVTIVQLALSSLLYSFNWELPNGMKKEDIDIDPAPGLAAQKKIALCLAAKKV